MRESGVKEEEQKLREKKIVSKNYQQMLKREQL